MAKKEDICKIAKGFSTISVHGGEERKKFSDSVTVPIVQSSTYVFHDEKDIADYTSGKKFRYEYLRYGNPTINAAEKKLAELEGAESALLFASGMSAITTLLFSKLKCGDHVIITSDIYKKTMQFVKKDLGRFGVKHTVTCPVAERIAEAIRPETALIFAESPTNPYLYVTDVKKLATVAKKAGVPVIIDATFATPLNLRPIELGADLVVHSATKYLSGHNDIMGGVILGRSKDILEIKNFQKTTGGNMDPHCAYLLIRGLKTLALRVQRQNDVSMKLASWLEKRGDIERVWYPGLKSHPSYKVARAQMSGFGGVLSFEVSGNLKKVQTFLRTLKIIQMGPSLGGTESLISHPATITYYDMTREQRYELGITDQLVRLAVGVEDLEDLKDDLDRALSAM